VLHLAALDEADLPAVSAQLQDALFRFSDVSWKARQRQFVVIANRFAWDASPDRVRRRSALRINYVKAVRRLKVDRLSNDTILSVLALGFRPAQPGEPDGTLTIACAGGHAIALDVECIDLQLDDLGPAWAAKSMPGHDF
jgi:hypothetical protein